MENELELNIKDIGDTVYDAIADEFDKEYENVKSNKEYAPYGDTQVCVGEYIDEDDNTRIREKFKLDYDFDTVMDLLKDNEYFKRAILDMVEYVAWNREG